MQGTLNFLKLNNSFLAAININITSLLNEVTGETMPEMRTMLKAMLNNGKAVVRLIKSITLKPWI